MFKLKSIAARLVLAIALTVAVACAILSGFSITQQRALTRMALDQQLKLQYESVIAAIDYEGRSALAVSSVIAALPPVGDAIAKGDRDSLDHPARRCQQGAEGAGHPADHLPGSAGDLVLPRPHAQVLRRRRLRAPRHRGRGAQDRPPDRRRRAGPRGARHLWHDADRTRRQEPRQRRRRRRLRQGIRRTRQEALRHRPRGLFRRRQEFEQAILDLRRERGRQARRIESRDRRRAAAARGRARRSSGRGLCRADQELCRRAGRRGRDHQGHDGIRGRLREPQSAI